MFDFDELDALEALAEATATSGPAFASFDFDELEELETPRSEVKQHQEVKTADPETNAKFQQALEDAVRRRRKAAGLTEVHVGDSDLTMKIQQAVESARLRKENSEPKELAKLEEKAQKALAGALERQNAPSMPTNIGYSSQGLWQNDSKTWNSGSTYGGWRSWPATRGTTDITDIAEQDGDGWDVPIKVGAPHMSKEARVQLGKACMDAKVLDEQLKKVLDAAKARQSQNYSASVPQATIEQIQKAQMVAESRSYVANQLLPNEFIQARRMAPYKPKPEGEDMDENEADEVAHSTGEEKIAKEEFKSPSKGARKRSRVWRPVQAATAQIHEVETAQPKHVRWADQSDESEAEAEGASPRQRGGG